MSKYSRKRKIYINEVQLGIGSNNHIKFKYSNKDKQIAYQLWVEINTRKIGLEFKEGKDVIIEVYNSWYEFFRLTRNHIKDIPIESINTKEFEHGLVALSTKVLNIGLRPHLTTWQAKFRRWYDVKAKSEEYREIEPQKIQKDYPYYEELIDDIKKVNNRMIEYRNLLYTIAFGKGER
jgi:hypothetical protein